MRTFSSVLILVFGFAIGVASANTFTVVNTNDSGGGSLRQAIINANTSPGTDTIAFNISGTGVHTISPLTALPAITDSVTIDGYTQPGSTANTHATTMGLNTVLKIELSGAMAPANSNFSGLTINADNCTVRGLVINAFQHDAIDISSNGNVITGNFIGTNTAGTAALPNGANGNGAVVFIGASSNNLVGGTTPAVRNLISGNVGPGVSVGGTGNTLQGNLIGTDVTGTKALGNTDRGVFVNASNCLIGGTTGAARNIISANARGIDLFSGSNNAVQGNFIGTDVTGTVALGNPNVGLNFNGGVSNNTIGGLTATPGTPPGNLISGNNGNSGMSLGGGDSGNVIQGNIIGADITGTQPLGNFPGGIVVNGHDNTVGGTDPQARNIIAFNGGNTPMCGASSAGIWVHNAGAVNNAILGNSIFSNAGLGIDLEFDGDPNCGVEPNDVGDVDTGPNNLQNYPVLETVSNSGGMTTVTARLNSAANTTYRIEFFANDPLDPSGYGEGKRFLGSKDVPTNGSGNANFMQSFPQVSDTEFVTATATDPTGNTSEFSAAVGQLLNVSTRMKVLTGNSVLIGGFIIGGTGSKDVVVRALGPTLTQLGVPGALGDPTLDLRNSNGVSIATNDNWKSTQQAQIMATGLQPPNDLEPAIRMSLVAGNYTAIVTGKNNTTGVALIEAYDVDKKINPTLTNISTRGFVDTGSNVMIGGFISGNGIVKVIVRALGPTLTAFGVPNVLADPVLDVRDAQGNSLATNDNWADTQQAEIQASGLAPPNAKESAIIIVRPPANTTAIVSGKNNTTGNALVEAYILPP